MVRYLYLFAIFILLVVVVFTLIGFIPIAEKLTTVLWILLVSGTLFVLMKDLCSFQNVKIISKSWQVISKHRKYIIFGVALLYVVYSSLQNNYYLGGDDTRLYYLYPWEYFHNYASKPGGTLAISNVSSFLPSSSIAAFVGILAITKSLLPFLNLQGFYYSINIVLAIYFFYQLLVLVLKKTGSPILYFIGACMYTFSIFNAYTLYNSQLIAVFLVSIFPMTLYLFIKSVFEKRWYFLLIIALVYSIFAVVSVSAFWFIASIIAVLPILLYLLLPHIKRSFIYLLFLFMILIVFNLHWLRYIPDTTLSDRTENAVNSIASEDFRKENANGVISTSGMNSLFYPMMNVYHRQIQQNFNWPYYPIFESWYISVIPLNIFFITSILFAGYFAKRNAPQYKLYIAGCTSFVVVLYLFTVNLGDFSFGNPGISLYVWMVNSIPGFVVFRNMYDKFAHGLSFVFAFLTVTSLTLLMSRISKTLQYTLLSLFSIVVCLNAKPIVLNEFVKLPVWTTSHVFQGIKGFNEDYLDLTMYARQINDNGKFLVLPMSVGNVISIQDAEKSNHYYVGVSPFLVLSGKNDFSGFLSFSDQGNTVRDYVHDRKYNELIDLFDSQGIKYIILNNDVPQELAYGYMYPDSLVDLQNEEFKNALLGEKVEQFGERYTLYNIKKRL